MGYGIKIFVPRPLHYVTRSPGQRTGLNLCPSASGCWISARAQILNGPIAQILNGPIRVEYETTLRAAVVDKSLRKAAEANFKANFSLFTSLSTGEAHVFGVKFIGLYGTVGFIAIRDFLFEEEAICGVTSGQRWMAWFPCKQRFLTTKQKWKICRSPTGDTQTYRVH